MIAEVTEGILNRLKADGLEVKEIAFKDLIHQKLILQRPAASVVVQTGDFKQVTLTSYKVRLDVSVFIVFQGLRAGVEGDARRKAGTYKILEAVVQSLLLQDLGLDLENPLIPTSFRNVTTTELYDAGYQVYQLVFWCSYVFTKNEPADEDYGVLQRMLVDYYLDPRDYTGMIGVTGPEASDLILLPTGVAGI
jgi:hypothetical protein